MTITARLEPHLLDPAKELDHFIRGRTNDGAVVSFTGLARGRAGDGEAVSTLHLEHYPGMTEQTILDACIACEARFKVSDILVVHRWGDIAPGGPIVFVAAASSHRSEAFAAADYLMDRLKTEAAFWKREDGPKTSRWIEPTPADIERRARWSD